MWIARNKDKSLWLYSQLPIRDKSYWTIKQDSIYSSISSKFRLSDDEFPNLKWEDEPVNVTLFSTEYERLVKSRRKFDYDKMNEYCKKQCHEYWDCRHDGSGHCDFVKRLFEIN